MQDAELFGLPPELREQLQEANQPPPDFIVMEENWQALEVFLACQTQWRHSAHGVTGLDYAALLPVISLYSPKHKKRLFDEVRLIELGALNAISKLREK